MPDGYSSHRALHRAPYPAERYRAASENRHYSEAEIPHLQRFRDKPARIPQPHSQRRCFGRGQAAEPAITGAAKAAAFGSLPRRAHDQEEHI